MLQILGERWVRLVRDAVICSGRSAVALECGQNRGICLWLVALKIFLFNSLSSFHGSASAIGFTVLPISVRHVLPAVYCLLPNKRGSTYDAMWGKVADLEGFATHSEIPKKPFRPVGFWIAVPVV